MNTTQFRLSSVLKEAWEKVHGVKRATWGAVFLFTLISAGGASILSWIMMVGGPALIPNFTEIVHGRYEFIIINATNSHSIQFLSVVFLYYTAVLCFEMFVLLPMRFGVLLISLRRAVNKSVSALFIFKFYKWRYIMRFIWIEVIISIFVGIPGLLSIFCFNLYKLFPGNLIVEIIGILLGIVLLALTLYLTVGYLLAGQVAIDRDESAWHSLEISRKAVTKKWFSIFFTLIWLALVMFIGALLLIIGLIWAIPYIFNVIAILYRDLVGIEGKDPVTGGEV